MVSIFDLDAAAIKALSDHDLLVADHRLHKVWSHDLAHAATEAKASNLAAKLLEVHRLLVREISERGLPHSEGGPPVAAKMQTDFGVVEVPLDVARMPALRLAPADAARVEASQVSYLLIPEDAAITAPAVLLAGDQAIGTVQVIEIAPATEERIRFAVPLQGVRRPWRAAGIIYLPFASPVRLRPGARGNGILEPGAYSLASAPVVKERPVVLAFVFDERDAALVVDRWNPPLGWSPPGGFITGREAPEEAARKQTLEETGIEMESAHLVRILPELPPGGATLYAVVGRARRKTPRAGAEVKEARWVTFTELGDFTRLSPDKPSFERALLDLRTFETAERVHHIAVEGITPEYLQGLAERDLLELDDFLHDRFRVLLARGVESEPIVNAHAFLLDELEARGIAHTREDELTAATARVRKQDAGRPTDQAPAWLHSARVGELVRQLPDSIVVCPAFVSLTGSYLYARGARPPNDVDIVYRLLDPHGLPGGPGAYLKLERAVREITGLPVQHIAEPTGPSWSSVPLYDLVLIRRASPEVQLVREDFARFIKVKLITDPEQIVPGRPVDPPKVGVEFYSGQPFEAIMEGWAARAFEVGPITVQVKGDGFSMQVARRGDRVWIFTEGGRDRSFLFPELVEWARTRSADFIVMGEFVPLQDGEFVPRQEGIWIVTAKARPEGASVRVLLHDCYWWGKENLALRPYPERFRVLEREDFAARKVGPDSVEVIESREVDNAEELEVALREMGAKLTAEGAMMKRADWVVKLGAENAGLAKWKVRVEVTAQVIGWRKAPRGRPPGVRWTREEAMRELPRLLRESRTYILRCALQDERGRLVPIEAQARLGPKDLTVDWDEAEQTWTGGEDPKLWTVCPGFPKRGVGDIPYGATFAIRWDPPGPKCGAFVDIAPGQFQVWEEEGRTHYGWMFPKPVAIRPEVKEPARVEDVIAAFERLRPEAVARGVCAEPIDEFDPDLEKFGRTAFSHWGSKAWLATRIAKRLPPHRVYVEPFAGSAAMLLVKDRAEVEVLADIDPEVIATLRLLRDLSEQDLARVSRRILALRWVDPYLLARGATSVDPLKRLAGQLALFRLKAFGYSLASLRPRGSAWRLMACPTSPYGGLAGLLKIHRRLKGVKIARSDWKATVAEWDSTDTLFYLDPPYPSGRRQIPSGRYASGAWTMESLAELASWARRAKGQILLSLNGDETLRRVFPFLRATRIFRSMERAEIFLGATGRKRGSEFLLANFPLEPLVKAVGPEEGTITVVERPFPEVSVKETCAEPVDEFDPDLEKVGRTAFKLWGSKAWLASRIAKRLPSHRVYVEPFAGSAAMLLGKDRAEVEVLSEIDPDIVAALRLIRDLSENELERVGRRIETLRRTDIVALGRGVGSVDRVKRLAGLLLRLTLGFVANRSRPLDSLTGPMKLFLQDVPWSSADSLLKVHSRLKGVKIYRADYWSISTKFDSAETLFYLDPPYPDSTRQFNRGKYWAYWTLNDLKTLSDRTKKLKGLVLLSLSGDSSQRRIFPHLKAIRVRTRGHRAERWTRATGREAVTEFLLANFDLHPLVKSLEAV